MKTEGFYSYLRGRNIEYSKLNVEEKMELVKEYIKMKSEKGVLLVQKSFDGKTDALIGKIKEQASTTNA